MKYVAKEVMKKKCDAAFRDEPAEKMDAVVRDAIIEVRSVEFQIKKAVGSVQISIEVIFYHVFGEMLRDACKYKVQVAAMDKQKYVTIAKQAEQRTRDAKSASMSNAEKLRLVASVERALPRASLEEVKFSAADWGCLVRERELRQLTITLMCRYASERIPVILAEMGVAEGTRIILDYQDMGRPGTPGIAVVLTAGGKEESTELANELGEFDVVANWWVQKVRGVQGVENVLVKSIDTDLLVICTLLHREGEHHYVQTTLKKKRCFFDIATFHNWLCREGYQLEDFVKMYIMAGSDFVDACPGMTPLSCMTRFFERPGRRPIVVINAAVVNGSKRPASKLYARMQQYDSHSSEQRADWCLSYWSNPGSMSSDRKVFGNGWSVDDGATVPTNMHTSRLERKRMKL